MLAESEPFGVADMAVVEEEVVKVTPKAGEFWYHSTGELKYIIEVFPGSKKVKAIHPHQDLDSSRS